MATLQDFFNNHPEGLTLPGMVKDHGLVTFFETGTGMGDTLVYVKDHFRWVFSMECYDDLYKQAKARFADNPRIQVLKGFSGTDLSSVLYKRAIQEPTMFFLDAHFPGADYHYESYESELIEQKRMPLKWEIQQIVNVKNIYHDVFIIDDLWFFEQGNFGAGPCPIRKDLLAGSDTITVIEKLLKRTHIIKRDYRYQGFLIFLPKQ